MMDSDEIEIMRWVFAGQALSGLIARDDERNFATDSIYRDACFYADGLIEELTKKPEDDRIEGRNFR